MAFLLRAQHAHQMIDDAMIAMGGKKLLVQAFGLCQIALFVADHRLLENCPRVHGWVYGSFALSLISGSAICSFFHRIAAAMRRRPDG